MENHSLRRIRTRIFLPFIKYHSYKLLTGGVFNRLMLKVRFRQNGGPKNLCRNSIVTV